MTERPELKVLASDMERRYLFEQRFSPPEFHDLEQIETPDGIVYAAAIGGLLRAQDIAEVLAYPLDKEPRLSDVSRGLRMLTYPKGIIGRLIRRSRNKGLQAVNHVGMRDDLRGIRSVLHQAPDVIEADLQLFGSAGKTLVARDHLSGLPSMEVTRRVKELPEIVFDELAAAALKRQIHNYRVSPGRRKAAIDEYLSRIGIDQASQLIEQASDGLFYDMWRAFGFVNEQADTWALRAELPLRIQRMITQGPEEFLAETIPGLPRQRKRPKEDYVDRTHVRFYPKTNRPDKFLQPMIAWSLEENGIKKLVLPRRASAKSTPEGIVQRSYVTGAALLAGLATEGPDYARHVQLLLRGKNHYPKRGEHEDPYWAAGLLPLFLPLGEQSIVRQIPSEGYFRRQKSQAEMNDMLQALGEGGLFGSGETL